jgi:hypothetical protein
LSRTFIPEKTFHLLLVISRNSLLDVQRGIESVSISWLLPAQLHSMGTGEGANDDRFRHGGDSWEPRERSVIFVVVVLVLVDEHWRNQRLAIGVGVVWRRRGWRAARVPIDIVDVFR